MLAGGRIYAVGAYADEENVKWMILVLDDNLNQVQYVSTNLSEMDVSTVSNEGFIYVAGFNW
ncbi:MAG: hypothetical protein ACUVQ0_04755 [Thermoproteota archaeon]